MHWIITVSYTHLDVYKRQAFIHFGEVFDSITGHVLWEVLNIRGYSKHLVNVLRYVYSQTGSKTSEPVTTNRGVRQQGVCSVCCV